MKDSKNNHSNTDISNSTDILKALHQVQAIVEFNLDGTLGTANENFLKLVGYTLDEIKNAHHGRFCDRQFLSTVAYHEFWNKLGRGISESGRYMYVRRGGQEVWVQASYIPVLDSNGRPFKILMVASDISAQIAVEKDIYAFARTLSESIEKLVQISRDDQDGVSIQH